MSKNVLIITASLRPNSNSDALAAAFADGARRRRITRAPRARSGITRPCKEPAKWAGGCKQGTQAIKEKTI